MTTAPGSMRAVRDGSALGIGLLLRPAHDAFADAVAASIRPLGLELRHFWVLMRLESEEPASQIALAGSTHHDKASMVRIVDDLERLGLAVRTVDPADRRVRLVTVTARGRSVCTEARALAEPAAERALEGLGPGEREQLRRSLQRLAGA